MFHQDGVNENRQYFGFPSRNGNSLARQFWAGRNLLEHRRNQPRSGGSEVSPGRKPWVGCGYGPGTYFTNQTGDILYTWVRSRRHVEESMPWKVSGVVERRKQFVAEYGSGEWTMTDLCQAYGISRPTGYEVLRRYERAGELGLEEQSRAPQRHPNQTPAEIDYQECFSNPKNRTQSVKYVPGLKC